MNVEELMRDSLREQAAEQAPAGPGFADRVLTARRRRRTRTLASVAAATAAVVAIAVAVPLLDSGKDDVRPAGVTQQGGISADPDRSQPRDMIAAGRQVLAAYYTAKAVPQTKDTSTFQRTYWLLDPKTGKYKKDTRWSYVAVAPGLKTAAVLERTLPAQRIGLLDLATGEVERWIPAGRGVGALAFSSDGRRLVATTYDEDPDGLVPVENGDTGAMSWMAPYGSSRTGFFVLDLAGNSGYAWWRVANDRHVIGRADFAFTRDGKHLFARVTGEKDGMERFYDLSGKEVDPPAEEKYLRWDVPARLSPDGRLAALGLIHEVDAGKTYSAKSYSSIRDPRTGKKITMVRGGHLLAWADNKRLIAWERTTAFDEQPFRDRLVLVTIGSDKVVPLSGSRAQNLEEPAWEPVFAER
ncbi:WD40 repeat domain-containing protein [Streptomyces sp. NPDC048275]|uniref:WD40 repeat domain-containing protein n=1 Tax=Streptomyces sp. NPDC048275 TaxID=3155629 RepID=UPI0033CB8182